MKKLSLAIVLGLVAQSGFAFNHIEGTVKAVDLDNGTYTIESNEGAVHTITFNSNTTIRLDNRRYRDLDVLQAGDEVVYKKGLKNTVRTETIDATVVSIDTDSKVITFEDEAGNLQSMRYQNGARIKNSVTARFDSIERLRPGTSVELELRREIKADYPTVAAN